jgi:O-antigen/teichoic acid export membrane protein
MEHKREVWDTVYLIALQGFNYVAPLIVFPYLMIVLGAEKFGYIGFSLSVIQYLMLIVDFGLILRQRRILLFHKNNPTKIHEIFWATLYAKIGLLVISFAFLLIISYAYTTVSYI